MCCCLIFILFIVFYFFEMYWKFYFKYMVEYDGFGLLKMFYMVNLIEVEIMNMYDDCIFLCVYEVFFLVIWVFCRRFWLLFYVGCVEWLLRGYFKERLFDEVYVVVLCFGGMWEVLRFWEVKGYNVWWVVVDVWYELIFYE